MDNENVISLTKINKTVAQAITDKNTKSKANKASLTNGCETDEEHWAENIRQFILDEVKTSKEYTQDEIDYVERSLRETREAGHGDTENSEGGEEEHGAAASDGGEGEAKEAGHSNTANSKGGEAGHSNTANSEGGEEGHGYSVSETNVYGHGYSVSETNIINCLKSLKGVQHGDDMKDEQLCRRQVRHVRQKYMNTYS